MSDKIDDRIVQMEFDNRQFERGVAQTMGSMGELKKSLDMGNIANGVQNIASKFSAVGAVAFSALQRVTNAAIDAGLNMANALIGPLLEGGSKRALAIEQAKFQFKGLGMDVEATMEQALFAVKGTAFGLDEAATAAANLGASQVPIERLGTSLRAISGVAALSGSAYSDIADVFTKVAGQGRLMGDDLNRLAARGVNAAATLAQSFGMTESEIRDLVSEGEISFEEFAAAMDSAFGEHATKASETFSGASSNFRAALSRIGAAFAATDFEKQRRELNAWTPVVDNVAAALKPLSDWFLRFSSAAADATEVLAGAINFQDIPDQPPPLFRALGTVLESLTAIATVFQEVYNEFFPPATDASIKGVIATISAFAERLKMGEEQLEQFRRIFRGAFAVFDTARIIVARLWEGLMSLFKGVGGGGDTFLEVAAKVGDFLVKVRDVVRDGNVIETIFEKIRASGKWVIDTFENIKKAMSISFDNSNAVSVWDRIQGAWQAFVDWLPKAGAWIADAFNNVKKVVQDSFQVLDFEVIVGLLNVGALAGLGVLIKKIFDKLPDLFGKIGGGFFDSVKGMFDGVTGAMESMQTKLKADVLTKIAIAIGILALSMAVLAMIEPERLSNGLAAIAVMMISLMGTLVALEKFIGPKQIAKLTALSGAMIAIATAMLILSAAVLIMSKMDWNELARGMAGLAVGLGLIVGAMVILDKAKVGYKMLVVAPAMQVMAQSLLILATALNIMANMSWDEVGRGLTVMAGVMVGMVGAMTIAGKMGTGGALPILAMAGAMMIMSQAMQAFAELSWDDIARSMTVLVGVLAALTLAMGAMGALGGPGLMGAAAMMIVVGAILLLTGALKIMATMSWDDIGRSMVVLAGSLAILAGAMALMGIPLVMAGSIGILAASAAMMMLAPALKILGSMSWDDIGRGLTMLGGALAILAVGGILMIPASAGFFLLGAAALLIGTGIYLAAEGIFLFAAAFTTLTAAAVVGAEGLKMAIAIFLDSIPMALEKFGEGVVAFAGVIASGGEAFAAAFVTLIVAGLQAIQTVAPEIIDTIWILIKSVVDKVVEGAPYLYDAGFTLITSLLNVFANRAGELATAGANALIAIINAIGRESYRMADAAGDAVVKFVNALASSVEEKASRLSAAGRRLFRAVVEGVASAVENGGSDIRWAGERIGNALLEGAKNALGINSPSKEFRDYIMGSVFEGLESGEKRGEYRATRAGSRIGDAMLTAAAKSLEDISSAVATDMTLTPTIRPVIDMTDFRKGAALMPGMLTPPTLRVDNQYAAASSIEAQRREDARAREEERLATREPVVTTKEVNFYQTNNSPEPLDRIEIYRRTNNLFQQAKEALTDD